ncbi:hypothetical protein QU487_22270 [Crenobacter sp. SG2305]|uniref:hypothetical protein n=1 Tax=Crenobacter oryzisoli TaxID=3056844 RepID=UPI0025AB0EE8|nr:hypothetical protein [Crenobacter sp. SG2305]MDN0085429.1 hypothetical protein [Crenobacter sp. SG2305]
MSYTDQDAYRAIQSTQSLNFYKATHSGLIEQQVLTLLGEGGQYEGLGIVLREPSDPLSSVLWEGRLFHHRFNVVLEPFFAEAPDKSLIPAIQAKAMDENGFELASVIQVNGLFAALSGSDLQQFPSAPLASQYVADQLIKSLVYNLSTRNKTIPVK